MIERNRRPAEVQFGEKVHKRRMRSSARSGSYASLEIVITARNRRAQGRHRIGEALRERQTGPGCVHRRVLRRQPDQLAVDAGILNPPTRQMREVEAVMASRGIRRCVRKADLEAVFRVDI